MAKYIDAGKLKYELERRKLSNYYTDTDDYETELFEIIEEQPEVNLENPVPNDLEEAANEFANQDCVTFTSRKKGFIAGAKWQAERLLSGRPLHEDTVLFNKGVEEGKGLMMDEAVEGTAICYCDGTYCVESPCFDNNGYYKSGDKVRIIIVKEDEK